MYFTVLTVIVTATMKSVGTNKQWILDIFGNDLNATIGVACFSGLLVFALFSFLHWATDPAR